MTNPDHPGTNEFLISGVQGFKLLSQLAYEPLVQAFPSHLRESRVQEGRNQGPLRFFLIKSPCLQVEHLFIVYWPIRGTVTATNDVGSRLHVRIHFTSS